jgi:hypothetical protein
MDALLIAALYLAGLCLLALAILAVRDRIADALWRRRNPPETLAETKRRFEQRLLHPDWPCYERHLQRPAPDALRALFADPAILLSDRVIEVGSVRITSFEPIDARGLSDTRGWIGTDAIAFASCDGDPIHLKAGANEPDRVYITYHDGGETEELASDVAQFAAALRTGFGSG